MNWKKELEKFCSFLSLNGRWDKLVQRLKKLFKNKATSGQNKQTIQINAVSS